MIQFQCQCGKQYKVSEEYAGKKVRCKKCSDTIRVPSPEKEELSLVPEARIEPQHTSTYPIQADSPPEDSSDSVNGGLPKPLILSFVVLGVILVGLLLYVFVFRDTWENDNYQHISQMIRDSKQHYDYEEFDEGLKKYDELVAFIGDRELKREQLNSEYSDICNTFEEYKEEVWLAKIEAERRKKAAEIAKQKASERELRIQAERAERERKAEIAKKLEIQRQRKEAEAERKAKQFAKEQEKQRLNEERIANGYLTAREKADTLVLTLLDDGSLNKAAFSKIDIFPKQRDRYGRKQKPTYAEVFYSVEYYTKGGLYRKGVCAIALNPVDLSENVQRKYSIECSWKIRTAYVDETNIWGWNDVIVVE